MRKIVFDIETKQAIPPGWKGDMALMDISLLAIHDSNTNEYTSYMQEDFPKLWPILEQADMLIGYNSDHFDVPLLNKYYPGDLTAIKSVDLLKEIRSSLGRRLKMDSVAEATLGTKKSGHGLQAVEWWESGEIEKIRKYCIDDVRITKELYDYAVKNSMLKFKDFGGLKEIPLDISSWEEKEDSSITHTLPF